MTDPTIYRLSLDAAEPFNEIAFGSLLGVKPEKFQVLLGASMPYGYLAVADGIDVCKKQPYGYHVLAIDRGQKLLRLYTGVRWKNANPVSQDFNAITYDRYLGTPTHEDNEMATLKDELPAHSLMKVIAFVPELPADFDYSNDDHHNDMLQQLSDWEEDIVDETFVRFRKAHSGEDGLVTNVGRGGITGYQQPRNNTPEESRARSEQRKGKPNGSGQPIFIREADGTEHEPGSMTEAADLVMELTGKARKAAYRMVTRSTTRNVEALAPHGPTGLLICFAKHKDNPLRKTIGDRMVRVEDTVDGTVEEMTASEYQKRFKQTRTQLGSSVQSTRDNRCKFLSRYLVSWGDGEKRGREAREPIFDRVTGKRYGHAELRASGFPDGNAYRAARENRPAPYVSKFARPEGTDKDYYKTFFVFEADLNKPITPALVDTPVALLRGGDTSEVSVHPSQQSAAVALGLSRGGVRSSVMANSARIASGELPERWLMNAGTHVPIYLHELPAYCEMTGQEMPFSNVWYVDAIAKWQAENPRPNSKAAKAAKSAKMAP